MKTKIRTVVTCGELNDKPIALTDLICNGKPVHLGWISIYRCEGNAARLEMAFLEESTPFVGEKLRHYHRFVHEDKDIVRERLSCLSEQIGCSLHAQQGYIIFKFKLGRKQFCQQAIEFMVSLGKVLGIKDTKWLIRAKIYQETAVWHNGAWWDYARYLLIANGVD